MNLPWGGLSDIGPDGCKTCKFWNPPHASHNDGKEIDIGLNNLRLANKQYDTDRIHLLQYVSTLDTNFEVCQSRRRWNYTRNFGIERSSYSYQFQKLIN